jgi:hypothetical protein
MNPATLANLRPHRGDSRLQALEPATEALVADELRYCPTRMLWAFALLMAGHGRCVNTSMMLGDREYAMSQLARAHTLYDPELREIAARLFAYFDEDRAPVPVGLHA